MSEYKFDPENIIGTALTGYSGDELRDFAARLCDAVSSDAGNGWRGGIFPSNISRDEGGDIALGPASEKDWTGEELDYIAPETFWDGKRSAAGDVYSIGLLLYYACEGKLPFEGECEDAQQRRMSGDALPEAENAGELGEIIGKALSFNAADRYPSPALLARALRGEAADDTAEQSADEVQSDAGESEAPAGENAAGEAAADIPSDETHEPEAESSPEAQTPAEPAIPLGRDKIDEFADSISAAVAMRISKDEMAEDVKVYSPSTPKSSGRKSSVGRRKGADGKPIIELYEEKNPALAPISFTAVGTESSDTRSQPDASGFESDLDRAQREQAAALQRDIRRRRKRPVIFILVLCAALVLAALVFNQFGMDDVNDVVYDNGGSTVVIPTAPPEEAGEAEAEPGTQAETEPAPEQAPAEHTYSLIVSDISWTDAAQACRSMGGYLAVISSEEELERIVDLAENYGVSRVWIGCHRENGQLVWENGEQVDFYRWGEGEPSVYDYGDGVYEDYVMLWDFYGWVYNDNRNAPFIDYPGAYSGQMAYVCEFGG